MTRRQAAAAGLAALALAGAGIFTSTRPTQVKVLPATILPQVNFVEFKIDAPFTHVNSDDMVVAPGQPGASHPHLYFCNQTADAFSDYASLNKAKTTCFITFGGGGGDPSQTPEPGDRAGYWIPLPVFDGVVCDLDAPDDSPCPKAGATAWYSNPRPCPDARPCTKNRLPVNYTFPRDFRMIAGKATGLSLPNDNPIVASDNVFFNCYPGKGKTFGDDDPDGLNQCLTEKKGNRADVWIRFPSCWVGRGGDPTWRRDAGGWVLDSDNHRDHMAYPTTSGCPASHPIVLPELRVQVEFPALDGTSMAWSCGKWYCIHFDFVNAWDQDRLELLTAPSAPIPATASPTPTPAPTATRTRR